MSTTSALSNAEKSNAEKYIADYIPHHLNNVINDLSSAYGIDPKLIKRQIPVVLNDPTNRLKQGWVNAATARSMTIEAVINGRLGHAQSFLRQHAEAIVSLAYDNLRTLNREDEELNIEIDKLTAAFGLLEL